MFNSFLRCGAWLLLIIAVCLLNGCGSKHRKDGPPDFYVDETKIPDAVPKIEPLSRIGNKPSYVVFGRRYYVMPSSKGYHEQGIASWYGTAFHARNTSNGERYNMLSMSAAHKTLPLPTYVQVTNLANGKKVIVKVNDRGPFEANRLIDLSYVAAKKLGMLGHGTAHVDIMAIDPRTYHRSMYVEKKPLKRVYVSPKQREKAEEFVPSASVYLQVGAFRNKSHAVRLQKKMMAMFNTPVQVSLSNSLYKVKIGPITNGSVDKISRKLKTIGFNGKRVHKDFDLA